MKRFRHWRPIAIQGLGMMPFYIMIILHIRGVDVPFSLFGIIIALALAGNLLAAYAWLMRKKSKDASSREMLREEREL